MAGIGPAPFCAMMLSDMGAEVIRVDRTHRTNDVEFLTKGRQGGTLLAFGIVCALLEARTSGRGQVIDAAMVDGAALLMANIYSRKAAGVWTNERGKNALDGGAHWYGVYECSDGKYISIGAIEPQFYRALLEKCGIDDPALRSQWQREEWPALREKLARIFLTRTRPEWCVLLEGSDACFAPVLDLDEAAEHPQNRARSTFVETDGA